MASIVKIKRSSVQGKAPTISDIQSGELALNTRDGKLYSSSGTAVFEIGANVTSSFIGSLTTANILQTSDQLTDLNFTVFNSNTNANTTNITAVNDLGKTVSIGITGSSFDYSQLGFTDFANTIGYLYTSNTVSDLILGNKANVSIYADSTDGVEGANASIFINSEDKSVTFLGQYQFPLTDGAADTFLKTDGEGNLSFAPASTSSDNLAFSEFSYTADEGQVSFGGTDDFGTTLTYTPTNISVFLNGVKLIANTDFLASNGTSVFLSSGAANNDVLDIQAFTTTREFVDVTADLKSNTETVITASTVSTVDAFPVSDYTTAKYLVQGTTANGTSIQSTELLLLQDTNTVYITEYATVNTVSTFITFDARIVLSNVELTATSDFANTQIRFTRMGVVPREVS